MMELITKAEASAQTTESLTLPFERRQKSRLRARLDCGVEVGVLLAPGTRLFDGDVLRASDGTHVRVRAAKEAVSCARTDDALQLARACYHLGNRHVPVQIGPGWLRYKNDHVLDDMVRGLGLAVTSEEASFEPDGGAYDAHVHGRSQHGSEHHHSHSHNSAS